MKKIKYQYIIPLLVTISACNDFLSQQPDNRTEIDTAEKIAELLVSAYPEMNYIAFCEAMSDNVTQHAGGVDDPINSQPYFWEDASETEQDSPEAYWQGCYAAIAAANHALEAISNYENPSQFNAQKGEALVARAYAHFMLVSLFAKMYNEETAASDPGIPYVTEPETVALKTYQRRTVQYVYDMIERDLTMGLPLINDEVYDVPAYHFTTAAAHAFAVRFYLFKKEYESVVEHANQVFPDNDFASRMRPWNTVYGPSYNFDEITAAYTKSTDKANLLLCETSSLWARTYTRYKYATGIEELESMESIAGIAGGNFDFDIYFDGNTIYFIPKFREHFVREDISANTGLPYTIVPLFTTEEVLLSRAEAYAYLGKISDAIADLNTYMSKRIEAYNPAQHTVTASRINTYYGVSNTQQNTRLTVIEATLALRQMEFLHEGLRWFDLLRYNATVRHETREGVIELPPDDPRRVLQIPREAISLAGLEPNPR